MSRNNPIVYFLSGAVLLLVMACVVTPVVPTPQQPISTSNPGEFSTMVAGMAAAFMTQTMAARPTPTETLLPVTATPTPIITTPTLTERPTDSGPTTSLTEMEDGSMQFFDYLAGVKLTIPMGWIPYRLNDAGYDQVLDDAEEDSVLQYALEGVEDLDSHKYRLHAFNTQEGYVLEGLGSQITVLFFEDDTRSLEQILDDEEQHTAYTDYKFIASGQQVRLDEIELFVREEQWKEATSTDKVLTLYYKGAFFEIPTGTMVIELRVPLELMDNSVSDFDLLIEQLSVFKT